jgi:alpha-mannosidase
MASHSFVATTAQQYKWLETLYPKVFERLKQKVKKDQFGKREPRRRHV